jgi:hypothetical protein
MTTQLIESGKQEDRKNNWGTLHTTRFVLGRLALSKGEGEDEGLLCERSEPLTSVLSPRIRGEVVKIRIDEHGLR